MQSVNSSAEIDTILRKARARVMRALHDDDSAQSVLMSLWRELERGPVEVDRFLSVAMRNKRADEIRRLERQRETVAIDDESSGAEDLLSQPSWPGRVRDFTSLDATRRKIAVLLQAGHSIGELPGLMGMSRATFHRLAKEIRAS